MSWVMNQAEAMAQAEHAFGSRMQQVLSPSQTIQHPGLLRGRQKQLDEIRKAFLLAGTPSLHLRLQGGRQEFLGPNGLLPTAVI